MVVTRVARKPVDIINNIVQQAYLFYCVDVCLQFLAPEPDAFVIRGAVKLIGARTFGTSLAPRTTRHVEDFRRRRDFASHGLVCAVPDRA